VKLCTGASSAGALALVVSIVVATPASGYGDKIPLDALCGPRCVHFVAKYLDMDNGETLVDVIRGMQGKDLDKGSTLAEISAALKKRGIHTRAVELTGSFDLRWDHPIIIHLPGDAKRPGHFAVWLPSLSGYSGEVVWLGLAGGRTIKPSTLSVMASNVVLLTAPDEISDLNVSQLHGRRTPWWAISGIAVTLVLCVCLFVKVRPKSAVAKG
jgi:ABC-type bacteriocin/lantibiotic exporter with double-glycine peptidase domain